MKSFYLLLFLCTLHLPANARSLSQPPKGPGDKPPVCVVWNGKKETPPEEKIVDFGTHFCAATLEKDRSGPWRVARLYMEETWEIAESTTSVCFQTNGVYKYVCVGDRCTTAEPVKESTKKSVSERKKDNECRKATREALAKSLPLLYPTAPSPTAHSLHCLVGSPPYARPLPESQSHCVVRLALDPVRESCEVVNYSALRELKRNLRNNTCTSEGGHAVCHCDSPQCNWELEKFQPSLISIGHSPGSRALSSCKPKPQCAVMNDDTKAVKFADRKETEFCFIEYSSDGTVKRMGREELKNTPMLDRMCQVRGKKRFVCYCKSHKCVAEFVVNNTPVYDRNWSLLKRTEKYATKLTVRHCGNPNVWTYDPDNTQICTKVFAKKGQHCSVSYEFIGKDKRTACIATGEKVQCTCKTDKCNDKDLKGHLRKLKKQIDGSRKNCLIDVKQRNTVSTTAPRNTDIIIKDEVGTSTVRIQEQPSTRQEKEKATTTAAATASTTQRQKTNDGIQSNNGNGEDVTQITDSNEKEAATGSDSTPVSESEELITDGKSSTSSPIQKTTRASNPERDTNENSEGRSGKGEDAKKKETETAGGFPNWAIYLIVGLVLLGILTYIVVVAMKWRKEKKDEAERERIRQSMPWNQEVVKKTNNEPLPPRRKTLRQMMEEEALAREKKRVRRIELIKANQATRPDVFSDRRFQKMGPLKFSHIPKNLPSDPLTSSRSLKDDAPVEYDDSKNMIYLMGSSVEIIDDTVEATQPSERADDPKSLAVERTQPSERVGGDVNGPKKDSGKKQEKGGKGKEASKRDGKEHRKEGGAVYKTPEEMV